MRNIETVKKLYHTYNTHQKDPTNWLQKVKALCANNVKLLINGVELIGHQGIEQSLGGWAIAFPGSHITSKSITASANGNQVYSEFVGEGYHTGGDLQTS